MEKSTDGVLGIRTPSRRMVGAYDTTASFSYFLQFFNS